MHRRPNRHCRECGQPTTRRLPDDGDTKPRAICTVCQTVHYENPLNVVGTVPVWGESGEQVLLCLRNIEPRKGKWTLPAGFMELQETTAQGALRETVEEAGAQIEMGGLFTLMSVPRVGQVHMYYRARLLSPVFDPGFETLEAKLFTEDQIPWDEIAFHTVSETLKRYFEDQKRGIFSIHTIDID